jgi:hypothetical protein
MKRWLLEKMAAEKPEKSREAECILQGGFVIRWKLFEANFLHGKYFFIDSFARKNQFESVINEALFNSLFAALKLAEVLGKVARVVMRYCILGYEVLPPFKMGAARSRRLRAAL